MGLDSGKTFMRSIPLAYLSPFFKPFSYTGARRYRLLHVIT
jgi:hypothetical protein